MSLRRAKVGTRRRAEPSWTSWRDEEILGLRLCELGVRIGGTWVEPQIDRVREELSDRDLKLRPHFWMSDEWQSPDGVPGVAVPFYLAHKRLMSIERQQMFEVEGGTAGECQKLLRHEVGHAVQHGFRLHRRKRWQGLFGHNNTPYPERYRPDPASRNFVQHLPGWYAQSHPAEDFAETFAVWLSGRSRWKRDYKGWAALEKLEYVDELMEEVSGVKPPVQTRRKPYCLTRMRKTLRRHYAEKRAHYAPKMPTDDATLQWAFEGRPGRRTSTAVAFVRRHRAEIRELVSKGTETHPFTIDLILEEISRRCQELGLQAKGSARNVRDALVVITTARTVHLLHRGRQWHAM